MAKSDFRKNEMMFVEVTGEGVKCVEAVKVNGEGLHNLIKGVVGDGKEIRFLLDNWVTCDPLKAKFPLLFNLEKDERVCVNDRFSVDVGKFDGLWQWARRLVNRGELMEIEELNNLLEGITTGNKPDKWLWLGGKDNLMTVRDVKPSLLGNKDFSNGYVVVWCKWIPKKCNLFMWRAAMDRIPTKLALKARDCFSNHLTCVLCGDGGESIDHLFCECGMAARIWHAISSWCNIPPFFIFSIKDLLEFHEILGKNKTKKNALKGIIMISCWYIWKSRNEIIFNNFSVSATEIIQNIKSLGFLWYKVEENIIV
uniref:uncharacterized protein LOC122610572 n=1 Tax=Erigeron canadensis TaxID=72917 RepID=UPI001CB98A85|nr:uncharacterized protein LOC122610572 [Erigeron canadensis]